MYHIDDNISSWQLWWCWSSTLSQWKMLPNDMKCSKFEYAISTDLQSYFKLETREIKHCCWRCLPIKLKGGSLFLWNIWAMPNAHVNMLLFVNMYPVCPSRPYKYEHARIYGHLWKIARITPVFVWFCPYFGDSVLVQSVIELCQVRSITLWILNHKRR